VLRKDSQRNIAVGASAPEIRQPVTRDLESPPKNRGIGVALTVTRRRLGSAVDQREDAMSAVAIVRGFVGFCEHALVIALGFVLMVIGLALGVTMIMLPVGVVVGLIGFAMFVAGLFVRFDRGSES